MNLTPRNLRGRAVLVVGAGQIGGSIIQRLSRYRPNLTVLASDHDRRLAASTNRYATWITRLEEGVAIADIVLLCVPVPRLADLLDSVAEATNQRERQRRLLVLDTGSLKSDVIRHASRHRRRFDFVGLHPLAGNEGEGWMSASAELFVGHRIVYCAGKSSRSAVATELIRLLGAEPLPMDAVKHDQLFATAIGLPHLLAYAAQNLSVGNPLCSNSWASLTRVAASNPEMVAGFLSPNRTVQKRIVRRFERELRLLTNALAERSGRSLVRALSRRRRHNR